MYSIGMSINTGSLHFLLHLVLRPKKRIVCFFLNISILFSRWFREEVNSPMDALRKKNIIFTLNIIYLMVFLCDVRLTRLSYDKEEKNLKLKVHKKMLSFVVCLHKSRSAHVMHAHGSIFSMKSKISLHSCHLRHLHTLRMNECLCFFTLGLSFI